MRQQTFLNKKATLYIVATPIGNLEDISKRTINILSSVSLIACEDTRETIKIINHLRINKKLVSCHEHNERKAAVTVVDELKLGNDVALVSDAGYPLISDPGSYLINLVLENNFNVSVIPGASAFLSALVASNLPLDKFLFYGFLSSKKSSRKKELDSLKKRQETIIFYESPYRINDSLNDIKEIFGERVICIARELTKKFEEYIRGNISYVIEEIKDGIKGEIVLIVEGEKEKEEEKEKENANKENLLKEIKKLKDEGFSNKDTVDILAKKYKIRKNDIYSLYYLDE